MLILNGKASHWALILICLLKVRLNILVCANVIVFHSTELHKIKQDYEEKLEKRNKSDKMFAKLNNYRNSVLNIVCFKLKYVSLWTC